MEAARVLKGAESLLLRGVARGLRAQQIAMEERAAEPDLAG